MKIVVNARLLRKDNLDGIGWVAYNILKLITKWHPDTEFHFLFDSGIEEEFIFSRNVKGFNIFPPAKHAVLNLIWFELGVKNHLRQHKPDLFFSPDGALCLGWSGKQIGIIHDLNFLHRPKDLKSSNRVYYNYFFPRFAKKATRILTVSNYSKADIVSNYQVSSNKVDVIKLGINDFFKPLDENEINSIRQRLTNGEAYFLFVGTLHPRKNIINLLRAFEVFKNETGSKIKLVLSGKEMYKAGQMHAYHKSMLSRNDVIFTGRLSNEELVMVYNGAIALTFVPYFEGFGLPLIEAMKCDIPIICSDTTSMPEVAGSAAIYVNPSDINEIKEAMKSISYSSELREDLVRNGRIVRDEFSWEICAAKVWENMVSVL